MPHPFSGLTTLTLALALFVGSLTGSASAQATGIADLPDCAADCVRTSATAANCALTDVPCLCSTGFSPAVQQCAIPVCGFGDRSTISGVLREMCESQTTPTSQPPTTSSSPPTTTPNSAPAPSPSSTTTITRTTTPPSPPTTGTGTTSSSPGGLSPSTTLGVGTGRSSSSTSASASSTTVVVATVVLPQTTALGGAGSIKLGGGGGILGWVGVVVGALVGVGGLVF